MAPAGAVYLADVVVQLKKLKQMGDSAMAQVTAEQFSWKPDPESNSIGLTVKHMAGNMRSRWTDFLTSDGEKPDRHRDTEFEAGEADTMDRLLDRWNEGWALTLRAIGELTEKDLSRTITIRGEEHLVLEAINRQLVHYATHVGQIVFLAKHLAGDRWKTLSIPRGESETFEVSKKGTTYRAKG